MRRAHEPGEVLCDEYVVKLAHWTRRDGRSLSRRTYFLSGELRAAKVMRIRSGATDADLVAFRREALSLLNVGNHPFVVRLFDVREQGRDTVLLMEYVAPKIRLHYA